MMMMMSTAAFISPPPVAVFTASTVATVRGCLELAPRQKFRDFFLSCFAECEEKRGQRVCLAWVCLKKGMSENSTMEHEGDIINTEGESEH